MTAPVVLRQGSRSRLERSGLHAVAHLTGAHRVLSTSVRGGGERGDVSHLVNYQISEGVRHDDRHEHIVGMGLETWHGKVCDELGLPADGTVLMETAANMGNLALAEAEFDGITVWCLATAGVRGNATSPAEAALWHEYEDGIKRVPTPGTINLMVVLDAPLTQGALARTAVTLTEAKTSVLLDLGCRAKNSWRPATGTGTDQYTVACPVTAQGRTPVKWVGAHAKVGELISRTVREAVAESLTWQNGLSLPSTRNLVDILGFAGLDGDLPGRLAAGLPEKTGQVLKLNFEAVVHDPLVCAGAWALREVVVRARTGNLPAVSAAEAVIHQAALLAAGLAQNPRVFPSICEALAAEMGERALLDVSRLVVCALQKGFEAKWKQP